MLVMMKKMIRLAIITFLRKTIQEEITLKLYFSKEKDTMIHMDKNSRKELK